MFLQLPLNLRRKSEIRVVLAVVVALFVVVNAFASAVPWQEPARAGWALAWIYRDGRVELLPFAPQSFALVRLSPDERQIAVVIRGGGRQIWIYDLEGGDTRQLTFEGSNDSLVWSPDGTWLYFRSDRTGNREIWRKRVDVSGEAELVLAREGPQSPSSISADGKDLWFYEGGDIYRLSLSDQSTTPQTIRASEATTRFAVVSAAADLDDLFAYQRSQLPARRNVPGLQEVVVGTVSGEQNWTIGPPDSLFPSWSDDGRSVYYLRFGRDANQDRHLYRVAVSTGPSGPLFSEPEAMFATIASSPATYDVSADETRLLMPVPSRDPGDR